MLVASNTMNLSKSLYFSAKMISLGLAAVALIYSASFQAPVSDEFGHFYAGLSYWQWSDTSTYNVNPPLLRSVSALPGHLAGLQVTAPRPNASLHRPEFLLGRQLFVLNPEVFQFYLTLGRLVVVVVTLLGTALLFQWARREGGELAGWVAGGLWISQPQVLSHGALITGDIPCAVAMLASIKILHACITNGLTLNNVVLLGIVVGVAMSIKFISLAILPIVIIAIVARTYKTKSAVFKLIGLITVLSVTVAFVIAIPYRFGGLGKSISEFNFYSQGSRDLQSMILHYERYWNLPESLSKVPLPEQLLLGLDRQNLDFERGLPSFAAGCRSSRGWWWFYLYSMLVKLPLGTLLATLGAFSLACKCRECRSKALYLPSLVMCSVIILTSVQTGFAQQHRYILAAYPFLFLIVGVVCGRSADCADAVNNAVMCKRFFTAAILIGVVLTTTASILAAPNWLGYFNLLSGGKFGGYKCLFNDASDWGQDMYRVRDWLNSHEGDLPVYVVSSICGHTELRSVGADFLDFRGIEELKRPCYLVISMTDYSLEPHIRTQVDLMHPVELIGSSHLVFLLENQ